MSYFEYQDSPVSSNTTSAVARAYARFSKSPLVLLAILAYTGYTIVVAVQCFPWLEYLDECVEAMKNDFPYAVADISAICIFAPMIIITCGLWTMCASDGKKGAGAVRGGIVINVILSVATVGSLLLICYDEDSYIIDYLDTGEILERVWLPVGIAVFNIVASAAMCGFANAVEYTASYGKPSADGVAKAGILILITCVWNSFIYFDVFESMDYSYVLSALDWDNENMTTVIQTCRMIAYVLFGFAALNYSSTVGQAGSEDFAQEQQEFIKTMPPSGETWTCSCGRVNAVYCSSCVCGATKPIHQSAHTNTRANPVTGRIICPKCGRENSPKAKFCGGCGNKLIN